MNTFALRKQKLFLLSALFFLIIISYIFISNSTVLADETVSDTEAPSIPAGLSCTAKSTTSVSLVWEPSTDNIGVTGYDVYNESEIINSTTGASITITALTPDTAYTFAVRAEDAAGNVSECSNTVTAITLLDTPVNVKVIPVDTMITVSWDSVNGATGYDICVDSNTIDNGSSTTYKHTGLTPGASHIYKVKAKNATNESEWTELFTATTLTNINVGGTINSDTVWSSNNIYTVQSNLTIAEGVHLQIMPGTIVRFGLYKSMLVNGNVSAVGTMSESIKFTSEGDPDCGGSGASYWGAVHIKNTGEFIGNHINMYYGGYYYYDYEDVFLINEGKLILNNSYIQAFYKNAIYLKTANDTSLDGNHIIQARDQGIKINNSGTGNLSISNNTVDGCSYEGIAINRTGSGLVNISGNSITNCQSYPLYINLSGFYSSTFNGITDNTFSGNFKSGEAYDSVVLGGTVKTDLIVTTGSYIMQKIIIPQGFTMTLQHGVIFRCNSTAEKIQVDGVLNANGTADNPVVLTTYYDTEYGGTGVTSYWDLWDGVLINTTGEFNGDHVNIKYAGFISGEKSIDAKGKLDITNSTIEYSNGDAVVLNSSSDITISNTTILNTIKGISVNMAGAGNLIIQDCTIENSYTYGIIIYNYGIGEVHIERNTIRNSKAHPFYIRLDGLNSSIFGGISDNIFENNVNGGKVFDSMQIAYSPKTDLMLSGNKYYITTPITIPQDKTLIIQAGAVLRFNGTSGEIIVNGKLHAIGTAEQPVILTAYDDSKYGIPEPSFDFWGGVFISSTGEMVGDNVHLRYGRYYSNGNHSNLAVNGKLELINSQIYKACDTGISFNTTLQPILKYNSFIKNTKAVCNATPAALTIDAEMNYWDSVYGPGYNKNSVSSGISYSPWLGKEQKLEIHYGQTGVYAPTGNYSRTYSDLSFPSPGYSIDIIRTYNSQRNGTDGLFGRGWTFGYQCEVVDYYVNSVPLKLVRLPDGSTQYFAEQEDGTYIAQDSRNTLTKEADGNYTLKTPDQYLYKYNENNHLYSISDRNGNTTAINVDADGKISGIDDQVLRHFSFTYENGLIKTITDPAGRIVTYEYENNLLVRVITPAGKITRYGYDESGYLNEVRDTSSNLIEAIVYDHLEGENQNKVSQITDRYGNLQTYTYDNINKKVTVQDTNGREAVYWYDSFMFLTNYRDAESKLTTYTYFTDANGLNSLGELKSLTDRNGNITQYVRDTHGNITKITNPDTSTKIFEYDAENNLISEKDENGKYIFYIYDDAKKNLIKKAQPFNGTDIYPQDHDESHFAITTYSYYTYPEANRAQGLLHTAKDPNGNTATYEYDTVGNLVTVTDPYGNSTTNSYNSFGLIIGSISPRGSYTSFSYDPDGRLIKQVSNNNETTRIVYDTEGRKIKEISPKLYDSSLEDPVNNTYNGNLGSIYTYYGNGNVSSVTNAENQTISYAYDIYGNILTETRPNGSIYSYDYDTMNRVLKVWFKDNENADAVLLEENSYLILADKKTQTTTKKYINSTDKLTTVQTYNYANKLLSQKNNDNSMIYLTYIPNGLVQTEKDPKGSITTYAYDGMNRLIEKKTPFENISGTIYYTLQNFTYDANGNMKSEKITNNQPGQTQSYSEKQYSYNNLNQLVAVTTMDNGSLENHTQYFYDADGNKVRMYTGLNSLLTINGLDDVTANGDTDYSVTRYQYSLSGNLTEVTDPLGQITSNVYDLNGNLTNETDRNGNNTEFTYDNLDRMTFKSVSCTDSSKDVAYLYTYDNAGNIESTSGGGIQVSYGYDAMGRITGETESTGIVKEYTYDLLGNRTSFILKQNSTVKTSLSYTYDNMGRLYQVKENNVAQATYLYDINGNRQSLAYPNGNSTTYTYNLANRLKVLTNKQGTTTISKYTYTYHLDGNQASKTDLASNTTSYVYDGLGRLIADTESSGVITSYAYDDYSNRATMSVTGGTDTITVSYAYDQNNRLTAETKTVNGVNEVTSYGYDNNGNQVSKGTNTYSYDGLNRLIGAVENGQSITYTYNANDLRRSKTANGITTVHIWDGQDMAAELDGAGTLTNRYIRGINLIFSDNGAGTAKKYYLYNGHGDVIQLTNASGNVIRSYDYDAFGNEKNPDPNDTNVFRYCGEYFDKETGTIYLRARYYDPTIGRFITEDSVWGNSNDPLSLNLYTYCYNDPVNLFDPDGNTPVPGFWRTSKQKLEESVAYHEQEINSLCSTLDKIDQSDPAYSSISEEIQLHIDERNRCINQLRGVDKATNFSTGIVASVVGRILLGKASSLATKIFPNLFTKAPEFGRKLDYIFGKATGDKHNIDRSKQMLAQLERIGVADTNEWRSYIEYAFRGAYYDTKNAIIQENGRIAKEFLLSGPNGILKVRTVYDNNRLITIEFFGKGAN